MDSALGDNLMGVNQPRHSLGVFPAPVPGPVQKSRHHLGLGLQHFEQRGVGAWGARASQVVRWAGLGASERRGGGCDRDVTETRSSLLS